jgi:hypothetical protein
MGLLQQEYVGADSAFHEISPTNAILREGKMSYIMGNIGPRSANWT